VVTSTRPRAARRRPRPKKKPQEITDVPLPLDGLGISLEEGRENIRKKEAASLKLRERLFRDPLVNIRKTFRKRSAKTPPLSAIQPPADVPIGDPTLLSSSAIPQKAGDVSSRAKIAISSALSNSQMPPELLAIL
jgi:hypothetical protein